MSDNATLVEWLRERSKSYMMGGPSSAHTSTMLDEAAARIAELEQRIAHQRVWLEEAAIRSYEARIAELEAERDTSRSYVDRVWQALGVLTYEAAGGKAVDELVADLRAERDKLAFALQVIAAGETTDPAAMARAALSDPSGE